MKQRKYSQRAREAKKKRFSHVRTSSDTETVILLHYFIHAIAFAGIAYICYNTYSNIKCFVCWQHLKYNLEALIMHYLPAKCSDS